MEGKKLLEFLEVHGEWLENYNCYAPHYSFTAHLYEERSTRMEIGKLLCRIQFVLDANLIVWDACGSRGSNAGLIHFTMN